ncbi:MAG TPA: class I SAM-dependent methyltransferase [Chloroflexota bacterium]|nr:class I SAM-dependent methyltransferase [Chloroflexota bacterium]
MTGANDALRRLDEQLARQRGAYLSYATEAGPALVEHHGQPPAELVDRLLDLYAQPDGCFLDVGCGAGHTLCRVAARVREAWGIDMSDTPLEATRLRAEAAGLTNVTVVRGNVVERADADQLPDGRFALALSRRGPNFNEHLVRKLAPGAYAVQELVGGADCADLRELLGRRAVSLYHEIGHDGTIRGYARLGLFPITSTEFFFEEFYRDIDHLEAYLQQSPANVSDWRFGPKPYVRERDRPALELYAGYHRTTKGIRLLRHRWVFALRRVEPPRYPVDSLVVPAPAGTHSPPQQGVRLP